MTTSATDSDDLLTGTAWADTITGLGGLDRIWGRAGNDALFGGAGNDSLWGEDGDDRLDGGAGDDDLFGGAGDDILTDADGAMARLDGGAGNDLLLATAWAAATLFGGEGDDRLTGGAGQDELDGGSGHDSLEGGAGDDLLYGDGEGPEDGPQEAPIGTAASDDLLSGGAGGDALFGGSGNDRLDGGADDDLLSGGEGGDLLQGGDGDDLLHGGAGQDRLEGGSGLDRFAGSLNGLAGDRIADFQPGEEIWVALGEGEALSAAQLSLAPTLDGLDTELRIDGDSDGFAETVVTLAGRIEGDLQLVDEGEEGALIRIVARNLPPQLPPIATQSRAEDSGPWSFQAPSAIDPDGPVLSYAATLSDGSPLPPWLRFDATTRIFSGTPPQDFHGTLALRLTASDGQQQASQAFDLVITPVNDAPAALSLSASAVQEYALNGTVVGTLSATDVDSGVLTYSLLDSAGGRFALSGNRILVADRVLLDFEQAASHVIQVRIADDQGASSTRTFVIGLLDLSPERLLGDARPNTLSGGSSHDVLDGAGGADRLLGGAGNDIYAVTAGDILVEAADGGSDLVRASTHWTLGPYLEALELTGLEALQGNGNALANRISGNNGANVLRGLAGDDTLLGGAGGDWLDGGLGRDRLQGGTGNDIFIMDSAGDTVVEAADQGTDQLRASLSVFLLPAWVENLLLTGTADLNGTGNLLNNQLLGNAGANLLWGGAGRDRLDGGAGRDRLRGGTEPDTLAGGLGNDLFLFNSLSEAGDIITYFQARPGEDDLLQISAAGFGGGLLAGRLLPPAQFRVSLDPVLRDPADSSIRFVWETDTTRLWYDSNGSAAGGLLLLADLQAGATLTAADIWIL
jgi:Ca2+-binding RTX toxin-like protein